MLVKLERERNPSAHDDEVSLLRQQVAATTQQVSNLLKKLDAQEHNAVEPVSDDKAISLQCRYIKDKGITYKQGKEGEFFESVQTQICKISHLPERLWVDCFIQCLPTQLASGLTDGLRAAKSWVEMRQIYYKQILGEEYATFVMHKLVVFKADQTPPENVTRYQELWAATGWSDMDPAEVLVTIHKLLFDAAQPAAVQKERRHRGVKLADQSFDELCALYADCWKLAKEDQDQRKKKKCNYCHKIGHVRAECRNLKKDKKKKNAGSQPNDGKNRTCYNCGKKGHVAKDCTAPKKSYAQRWQGSSMQRVEVESMIPHLGQNIEEGKCDNGACNCHVNLN